MATDKTAKADDSEEPKDDDKLLADARELFELAQNVESDNRDDALDDIRFARLEEQWPPEIVKQRQREGRPCLVINKLAAVIRQVVNDARQNKPSIKVHPADSGADVHTAEIINGLIRNIEYTSNADVAYDTATENAVTGGFGYFRINMDYAHEDTFDMDILIERVPNQFSVYGDPYSTAADSSDWNDAFVVEPMKRSEFEKKYKGDEPVDWDDDAYSQLSTPWLDDDSVMVCEWWHREEYEKVIYKLSDGTVVDDEEMQENQEAYDLLGISVKQERTSKCFRITQRIMTGAEILKTVKWPGKYIPIVPVYGDEINVEGKRYFRSLIRSAKDAQRMHNYWRTTSTELVALAPRAPFIGKKGFAKTDAQKWATANTVNHAYIEFDGEVAPERQPFAGPPAGALQEALNASDDIKAITGLYDASLGAKSNETSGRAILARQREGDTSTFHFMDNMARAIRHAGRILIDLIPHVYTGDRVVRVMGEDGLPENKPLGVPAPVMGKDGKPMGQPDPATGQMQAVMKIFDLTAGKYDLTVTTGPSYTTKREEAAEQMGNLIQAFPPSAAVVGPHLAKNLDWPGADEIAEELKALAPKPQDGLPPEVQKMIEEGKQTIGQLKADNERLTSENVVTKAQKQLADIKLQAHQAQAQAQPQPEQGISAEEVETKRIAMEAERLKALNAYYTAVSATNGATQPATQEPPDPLEGETKRFTAEAGHISAQAAHIKAQAELHAAQNPPKPEAKPEKGPIAAAAAAAAAEPKTKRVGIDRGTDGAVSGVSDGPRKRKIKLIRGPDGEIAAAEVTG